MSRERKLAITASLLFILVGLIVFALSREVYYEPQYRREFDLRLAAAVYLGFLDFFLFIVAGWSWYYSIYGFPIIRRQRVKARKSDRQNRPTA